MAARYRRALCAMHKLIHHAGISKVIVEGGYAGANGCNYLENHGVEIEHAHGLQDL